MRASRSPKTRYGPVAQAFHWAVAALVLVQIPLGIHAARLPVGLDRLRWLTRHKEIGIGVLVLVIARLVWRLASPPPPLPATMPRWERHAATATHRLLYALLIAAPLAGWAYASAAGLSVTWFGLVHVPDLVARDRVLAAILEQAHIGLVIALAALATVHVAAALRHAVVHRDGIMGRMLPGVRGGRDDD